MSGLTAVDDHPAWMSDCVDDECMRRAWMGGSIGVLKTNRGI